MLLQILEFIRRQKVVSNQQLAREFQLDSQALQPMLDIWLGKGRIRVCEQKETCKSQCFKCRTAIPLVYYRYLVG